MKQRLKRWASLLLALMLVVSLLPAWAQAEEGADPSADESRVDFVLVLDCSGSMRDRDPYRKSVEACKMFMDMMPVANIRVSVVTYGYTEGEEYVGTRAYSFNGKELLDTDQVHVLADHEELSEPKQKTQLKEAIDETFGTYAFNTADDNKARSPMGSAMMAAYDLLERNGATEGNGCIILMSDGDVNSKIDRYEHTAYLDEVSSKAKNNQWPIFTIFTNMGSRDDAERRERMEMLASKTGGTYNNVTTANDLSAIFVNVFETFMKIDPAPAEEVTIDKSGEKTIALEVPELSVESTFTITGSSITSITIDRPDGDSITIKDNGRSEIAINDAKIYAAVETGRYVCAKMFVPTPGTYSITIYGDPDTTATVYTCSISDAELVMIPEVSHALDETTGTYGESFTKDQKLTVRASFFYNGGELKAPDFCAANPATLKLKKVDGGTESMVVLPDEGKMGVKEGMLGYYYELDLSDLKEGTYKFECELISNRFRSGQRNTGSALFTMENKKVVSIGTETPTRLEATLNQPFDKIKLSDYFESPDGDEILYGISFADDRVLCTAEVDAEGKLAAAAGATPVEDYRVTVTARDADTAEDAAASHEFLLTVINQPMEFHDKLPGSEKEPYTLWFEKSMFNEYPEGTEELRLELDDYFEDPDGLPISYSYDVDIEGEKGAVDVELSDDGELLVLPENEGLIELTVTATDGLDTREGTIYLESVSGSDIFWATAGPLTGVAIAILIFIIIVIVMAILTRRVGGYWEISFDMNGNPAGTDPNGRGIRMNYMRVSKGAKFYVKDMLTAVLNGYAGGPAVDDLLTFSLATWFGSSKLMMRGRPFSGKGCTLVNVPRDENFRITHNGVRVTGKKRITSGTLRMEIENPTYGPLTVEMKLK